MQALLDTSKNNNQQDLVSRTEANSAHNAFLQFVVLQFSIKHVL